MTHRPPRPLARAVPLACLAAAAVAAALLPSAAPARAAGAAPARAAGSAHRNRTIMCRRYGHTLVRTTWGARFAVKNDNYGGQHECLAISGDWPNFRVWRSAVRSRNHDPQAYPFILRGCSWGTCSPGSGLPRQVLALRRPEATWYTDQRARGKWDAAFDIWFGRHPLTTGQARGAEMMIWLNARDLQVPPRARVVRVAGARWYLEHWRACRVVCWNYLQFRRVHPVTGVTDLPLMPFFAVARRHGWIRPWWWLENIEAGFELWRGGGGLATDWFWARA